MLICGNLYNYYNWSNIRLPTDELMIIVLAYLIVLCTGHEKRIVEGITSLRVFFQNEDWNENKERSRERIGGDSALVSLAQGPNIAERTRTMLFGWAKEQKTQSRHGCLLASEAALFELWIS